MTSVVNKIIDTYNYIFTDLADPRVNNYFLISSPWPVLGLTGAYLYICKSLGPWYMRDRQPYNLKNAVLLYNVFQVLMSTYLFSEGVRYLSSEKFSFSCDPVDFSDDPRAVRVAAASWWYFFCKITEFLDTIFFVLRKKNNQITFLHVYHHSLMALMMWVGAKYLPGGHGAVMATLNSFVHIVMYTYYLIAGLGPEYQKYVWWKKHVTVLQLVQFVIILIHNLNALISDCTYPKIPNFLMCLNAILFINLFGKFFYKSYIKASSHKKATAQNGSVSNGNTKTESSKMGTTRNGLNPNGFTNGHNLHENGLHTNGVKSNAKHKDE